MIFKIPLTHKEYLMKLKIGKFLEFMENLGIREYWDAVGCAWQGTAVACPEQL